MDISLALGGGGSRGNAHIGVLRRLIDEGFHIRAVAGTSAGGIVAALFAAGYSPEELESMFAKVDQTKLFGRSGKDGPSIIGLSGAAKVFDDFLGNRTFDDLKIPCAMTAVDIKSGREVILCAGKVVDAVLATIALPGIFPPRQIGDYQLVDGGMLDPVPVSVARSLNPNLPVVAVILSPLIPQNDQIMRIPLPVHIPASIIQSITRFRIAQAFLVFLQAVDAAGRMLAELRLKIDKPDVIIRPDVREIGLLDKVDIYKVVRIGEKAVEEALPDLKRAVAWPNRIRRRLFPRK